MIVLDTSILVGAFISFSKDRHDIGTTLIDLISDRGLDIYEPQLLPIELSGVLVRYKPRDVVKEHINEVIRFVNLVGCEEFHNIALEVALSTGCRAVDAFFIACAKKTKSILISNDKTQVTSARRAGVETYHLLGEYEKVLKKLRES